MKPMALTTGLLLSTIALAPGALAQGAASPATNAPLTAKADLRDTHGDLVGTAVLTQEPKGVRILVSVVHLPPGPHGFHIHASSQCDMPGFMSAGGHFNPDQKQHGFKNPKGAHAGDLPNLVVKQDGTAQMSVLAPHLTLSPGKYSLLGGKGTSLMIHEKADDYKSQPAGNAGGRIACGPITEK